MNPGRLPEMTKLPPGCQEVVRLMRDEGHRLCWGLAGPWMMRPGATTYGIHMATARALARRKVIVRVPGNDLEMKLADEWKKKNEPEPIRRGD